jgi:DNA-binding SARP family transcriptional activator
MAGSSPEQHRWTVELLGPCRLVETRANPPDVLVPSEFQALLVGLLVIAAPKPVGREQLCDWLWRGRPPPTARAALHNQVSRLRARTGDGVVETTSAGYRLGAPTDLDAVRLAADEAERCHVSGDHLAAHQLAHDALERFRGELLAELDALDMVEQLSVVRLEVDEIRRSLEDARLASAIALGRTSWCIREAERLVAHTPLDEGRWHLLVEALRRAGRRGDALAAIDRARRTLRSQLGLGLGERLIAAESALLGSTSTVSSRVGTPTAARPAEVDRIVRHALRGDAVVVSGEHGIGRSAVLDAAFRQVRRAGRRTAFVRVDSTGGVPLAPLEDLLTELNTTASPQLGRVNGFVKAVRDLADTEALVLIVDDVDIAGPTSRSTLLAASDHPGIGLIVSTYDTAWLDELPQAPVRVELGPLHPDAVVKMVADADPLALGAADAQWWVTMSGGNPYLLNCLLEDFADGQLDLSRDPKASGTHLAHAVQRRLDDLGVVGRAAVEATAVCGTSATVALVSRLATPQGVALMLGSDLVRLDDERLRFRHGATEMVVYHGVARPRRAELHLQVADHEDRRGGDVEIIAHHRLAATELDARRAVDAGLAAARAASGTGAHLDAARWYELTLDATELTGNPADRVRALIGRGDELRLAGDPQHAGRLLEAVDCAEDLGDATLIAEAVFALVQLGATSETGVLHQRATEVADRTLARLPRSHGGWAPVAAAASIAQSLFGDVDRSRQWFMEAEASAVAPEVRVGVLPATYLALGLPEDLERREELTTELVKLADQCDSAVAAFEAQHLAFSNALQRADGRSARRAVVRMGELVTTVGDVGRRWQYLYCSAAVAHLDGDLDAAELRTEEAHQMFSPVSPSRAFAARISQLLVIRLAQGRLGDLADTFAHLVSAQPEVAAWHPLYAATCVDLEPDIAALHARRALEVLPRDFTWLAAHVMGAHAAARLGHLELIDAYRQRLEPWAHRVAWQGTCAYGPVAGVLADLADARGDGDGARRHRHLANRLADALQAPVFRTSA